MVIQESKTKTKHRKRIVEKAKELFINKGIAQTSIKDICLASDIERQTFYNYFKNKESIAEYIYVQNLKSFYSEGFNDDDYQICESGYEKLEKHFNVLCERYFDFIEETVFLVHYDYYFQRDPDMELVTSIYVENNMKDPGHYFYEGIEDGSVLKEFDDNYHQINVITQSVGAYANRIIYRSFKKSKKVQKEQKVKLKTLIDTHLNMVKAKNRST